MSLRDGIGLMAMSVLMACTDSPLPSPPEVQVADSAGLRTVQVPPLGMFAVTEWRAEPIFSTRNVGGADLELFRVMDGLFLDDASLVLANAGSSELIILAPDGASAQRVGGEGDGPGEFGFLSRVLPAPGGGFFAYDWRLTEFDRLGELGGTRRLDPESRVVSLDPITVYEDGTVVAVLGEQRYFLMEGERRDTVPLLLFRAGATPPDTLATWLGLERAFFGFAGGSLMVPIGFARTLIHASNGEQFAIGSTDSLDVSIYSSDLHRTIRVASPMDPRSPSESDVQAWRDHLTAHVPVDNEGAGRAFATGPVRDHFPGFSGLALDSEGRLWVGEYVPPEADERRWMVFDGDGMPTAQIRLPANGLQRLPGRRELLAVHGNRLALLRTTRLEEEYVEVWEFHPDG